MTRSYINPSDVLNRAVRAGLPTGIEEFEGTLWAKNGAMLAVSPTRRSFRWVVTEADCMTDHEFAPSKFEDALAALVSVGSLPVPADEPEPVPATQPATRKVFTDAEFNAFLDDLFAPDVAAPAMQPVTP